MNKYIFLSRKASGGSNKTGYSVTRHPYAVYLVRIVTDELIYVKRVGLVGLFCSILLHNADEIPISHCLWTPTTANEFYKDFPL